MYAGGRNAKNNGYYLYTGNNYWTMSPSSFNAASSAATVFSVNSTGSLNYYGVNIMSLGVRPVINISPNVTITGSGRIQDPYVAV